MTISVDSILPNSIAMPVYSPRTKSIAPATEHSEPAKRLHRQVVTQQGEPRFDNLLTARVLERTPQVSLPMNEVKDQLTALEWTVQPTKEDPTPRERVAGERLEARLDGDFNDNRQAFDHLLKLYVNDIISIDTGTLEIVPTAETIDDKRWMSELYHLDGMVMTKVLDERGRIPAPPEPAYWKYGNRANVKFFTERGLDLEKLIETTTYRRFLLQRRHRPEPFSRDEVVWTENNPRPYQESVYGFGIVQQVQRWAEILMNQDIANIRHFSDDEFSKGVLAIATESQTELDRFRSYWKDEVKGKTDTTLPIVGGGGDNTFIPFQEPLKELQYLESQQWYSKLVWYLFGLNESEIGASGDVNLATAREHAVQVWRRTTKPLAKLIEHDLNAQLLPTTYEYHLADGNIEFTFVKEHPKVKELERERIRNDLQLGVATPNEVREAEGDEPLPWGDAPSDVIRAFAREHPEWAMEEWGGVENVPEPAADTMPGLFSSRPESSRDRDDVETETGSSTTTPSDEAIASERQVALREALKRPERYLKEPLRNERGDYPPVAQYVDDGQARIASVIEGIETLLEDAVEDAWPEGQPAGGLVLDVDRLLDDVDIRDDLVEAITTPVADAMDESAKHHANRVANQIEQEMKQPAAEVLIAFDVTDTFAFERMVRRAATDMTTVEDTVKEQIRRQLVDVADDGGTVGDATSALRETIDELSDSHARLVARTEVLDASRHGNQALNESTDLIQGKQWNATGDSRTRPWHEEMDGAIVPKDDDFVVPSGWQGEPHYQPSDYPRSAFVVGDDQPFNCRCDQRSVLDEDMPDDIRQVATRDGVAVVFDDSAKADAPVTLEVGIRERQYEVWLEYHEADEDFETMYTRLWNDHSASWLADNVVSKRTALNWADELGLR